jgi:hypothetical protein
MVFQTSSCPLDANLAERFPEDGIDALREIDFVQAASIASAAHRHMN